MGIRKCMLVVVFAALLLVCYVYLITEYNMKAIEFSVSGQISEASIAGLRKLVKDLPANNRKEVPLIINFIGSYGDRKLVMSSGLDYLARDLSIMQGRWIVTGTVKEVVLGEKAADQYFRSTDVVGQHIAILGEEYKIVGILKNSEDIYISFDESSKNNWNKKNVKFIIEDDKRLMLYVELLEGKLKALGLGVENTVVFRQEAAFYKNLALAVVLYLLASVLLHQGNMRAAEVRKLVSEYREQQRAVELWRFFLKNKRTAAALILKSLAGVLLILLITKLVMLFQIQPKLIPANLFSPSSYIEVVKVNLQDYLNRLENGISGILLEVHVINLFLLLYIGIALIINKRTSAV